MFSYSRFFQGIIGLTWSLASRQASTSIVDHYWLIIINQYIPYLCGTSAHPHFYVFCFTLCNAIIGKTLARPLTNCTFHFSSRWFTCFISFCQCPFVCFQPLRNQTKETAVNIVGYKIYHTLCSFVTSWHIKSQKFHLYAVYNLATCWWIERSQSLADHYVIDTGLNTMESAMCFPIFYETLCIFVWLYFNACLSEYLLFYSVNHTITLFY